MARMLVLCQARDPEVPKLGIRGTFSQKKKLWEALDRCIGGPVGWKLLDDVTEKRYDLAYGALCNRLRLMGRATILNPEGQRVFLIVDTEKNELKDWDTGEDGTPVPNPVKSEDDEEKGE